MTEYICNCCSHAEKGEFHFYVLWSDGTGASATRCPRCGELTQRGDVEAL